MEEQQIGSRYVAEALVGQGASGQVWQGRDCQGGRWAIKLLRSELARDPGLVNRFVAERSLLESVRHPHVVAVHDLVVEGSTLAIVMELVQGSDLRTVLRARGVIEPATVARWGAQVAGALQAAHAAGVVHRDVKPENVLIAAQGESAQLTDFGVARLIDGVTRSTMMLGTPQYMAPEIAEGLPPEPAVDLYSLGTMLYELCCGVPPFAGRGSAMATLRAHLGEVPGRPQGVPDVLWQVIAALMSKVPGERGGSAAQVESRLRAIAPALAGLPAAPRIAAPPDAQRYVTAPPPVDAAVAAPTMQPGVSAGMSSMMATGALGANPTSNAGWSLPPGGPPVGYASPYGPVGYPAPYPAGPPGYAAPPAKKKVSAALVSVLAGVLLGGGFIAMQALSGDDSNAQAQPAAASPTVAGAATPAPASPVASQAGAATAAAQAPGAQQAAPAVPAPTVYRTVAAAPVQQPAAPAMAVNADGPPQRSREERADYAQSLVQNYLDQAESDALSRSSMDTYFADSVQWYGTPQRMGRDGVYAKAKIDPSKPRTQFWTTGVESFTSGTQYRGQEADVIALGRSYERSSGERGTIVARYTLVYDGSPGAPRIAEVTERR